MSLPLFDAIEELRPRTYREKAEAWAAENPKVFALFERFALREGELKRRFGMKRLAEDVRWEVTRKWEKHEGFKINNSLISHLGRMIVEKHPHLAQFIEFRKAQGD